LTRRSRETTKILTGNLQKGEEGKWRNSKAEESVRALKL